MAPQGRLVRPFLPTKDFDLSRRFYEALGFELYFVDEVAIFGSDSGGFILQRYYQPEWAGNSMLQLVVDDLDAWWTQVQDLDLPGRFGVPEPKPPTMQSWGRRVAFIIDPAGVLWHVLEHAGGT